RSHARTSAKPESPSSPSTAPATGTKHARRSTGGRCGSYVRKAPPSAADPITLEPVDDLLLTWYSKNRRSLPWRETTDPYAIVVSEVMAQQTQVERVIPRWRRWLERWPNVEALAAASAADVILEWQGLGYNRRALNLH